MKKLICGALSAALMVSVFAGCASTGDTPAPAPADSTEPASQTAQAQDESTGSGGGSTTITYLSRYTNREDPRGNFFLNRLDEFQEQNPDINVDDISVMDSDAYLSKMRSLIAAGAVPDVFASAYELPRYDLAKNGAIRDVEPIIQSADWTGPTDEKFFLGYQFKDQGLEGTYGVPNNLATLQLFVNKTLLEEHGLEIPQTWEDIEAMVEPLRAAGITPLGLAGKNTPKSIQFFTMLGIKMHGMDLQKQFADRTVDWNSPEIMAVLEKYKSFIDMGMFGDDPISFGWDNVQADLGQGKAAMSFELSFQFAAIQALDNAEDLTCINVPAFADKPEYKDIWYTDYYEGLCIGSAENSPEYDAAAKLFSFMLSQETFNQYAGVMGGGAYPLEVEFDRSNQGNIMADFMEAYKSCTDITSILTAYCDDSVIADATMSELQTLYVGRTPEEVAQVLSTEYAKAFAQ